MKKKAAVYRYDEIDIGSVHSYTRTITHDDVSSAISFLASDQSNYLNGVNIVINGGGIMQ